MGGGLGNSGNAQKKTFFHYWGLPIEAIFKKFVSSVSVIWKTFLWILSSCSWWNILICSSLASRCQTIRLSSRNGVAGLVWLLLTSLCPATNLPCQKQEQNLLVPNIRCVFSLKSISGIGVCLSVCMSVITSNMIIIYLLVGLTNPYNHTYSESLWWKLFKNHKRTQIQRQRQWQRQRQRQRHIQSAWKPNICYIFEILMTYSFQIWW